MIKPKSKLYFYLTKRDKKGVRFLAEMTGSEQLATRITDLSLIASNHREDLSQIIHDSRMMWEPWIESAENIEALRQNLKLRGFSNLPLSNNMELKSENPIYINQQILPKKKIMAQKKTF
jgi:hypothetical protein